MGLGICCCCHKKVADRRLRLSEPATHGFMRAPLEKGGIAGRIFLHMKFMTARLA
jgi:hypothetical protein